MCSPGRDTLKELVGRRVGCTPKIGRVMSAIGHCRGREMSLGSSFCSRIGSAAGSAEAAKGALPSLVSARTTHKGISTHMTRRIDYHAAVVLERNRAPDENLYWQFARSTALSVVV